jgi:hypothetical protein
MRTLLSIMAIVLFLTTCRGSRGNGEQEPRQLPEMRLPAEQTKASCERRDTVGAVAYSICETKASDTTLIYTLNQHGQLASLTRIWYVPQEQVAPITDSITQSLEVEHGHGAECRHHWHVWLRPRYDVVLIARRMSDVYEDPAPARDTVPWEIRISADSSRHRADWGWCISNPDSVRSAP